jgi:hypothetical protein
MGLREITFRDLLTYFSGSASRREIKKSIDRVPGGRTAGEGNQYYEERAIE